MSIHTTQYAKTDKTSYISNLLHPLLQLLLRLHSSLTGNAWVHTIRHDPLGHSLKRNLRLNCLETIPTHQKSTEIH